MRQVRFAMLVVVLMGATTVLAGQPGVVDRTAGPSTVNVARVTPPARPTALTPAQYQTLQVVQTLPEHSRILGTSATYSVREKHLQATRFSDDVLTVVYDVGWPGFYLTLLLCALPL